MASNASNLGAAVFAVLIKLGAGVGVALDDSVANTVRATASFISEAFAYKS